MAHAGSYIDTYPKTPLIARVAQGLSRWMDTYAENHPRLRGVRALQSMSDAQLADRGIRREDIVHHVFRDTYYR